jgi:hypothetical protein
LPLLKTKYFFSLSPPLDLSEILWVKMLQKCKAVILPLYHLLIY